MDAPDMDVTLLADDSLPARAEWMPPDVTGFALPEVGVLSNVNVPCFPARAAATPPDVTGFALPAVGVVSNERAPCLSARAAATPPEVTGF